MTNTAATDTTGSYFRAQDEFEAVLRQVPADRWDGPSQCAEWTVRDVLGHTVWGLEMVRHLAIGEPYESRAGAPGSPHPGELVEGDPLTAWQAARDATRAVLADGATHLPPPPRFTANNPDATLADFLRVLVLDFLAHTWDIGHALGIDVRLPEDLLAESQPVLDGGLARNNAFFAEEITPAPDAGAQTRWLSFLGRPA